MVPKLVGLALAAFLVGGNAWAAGQDSPNVTVADIERHLALKDYAGAIEQAQIIVDASPWNADAFNLMGFALRHLARFGEAEKAYARALRLNPDHAGAHEYLGELYIQTGHIDQARAQLNKLEAICGKECREYKMLADAIAAAGV
jgi:tetratricopeptide (TPR) repeat protein